MADIDCAITEAPETPSEEPQPSAPEVCKPLGPPGGSPRHYNMESTSIDDDTKAKLKGDQIGDTMYNQSFVIKTLMRFNNLEEINCIWGEDLENDLCFIWDMTVEEDVCKFLFELNFPAIACTVLKADINHRLIEILIGILGNICTPDSTPELKSEHLPIILDHIDTDDHLILIQLMRFVKVIAFKAEKIEFANVEIMEKIIFILYNSMNVGLLEISLDAVDKMTSDKKLPVEFLHENLLEACFTAFKVIYDSENDSETDAYKTDVVKRNMNHLLQVLVNMAVYCQAIETPATAAIRRKVDEHKIVVFGELHEILKGYADEFDITEDVGFVFQSIDYVLSAFGMKCYKLTVAIIKMAAILNPKSVTETVMNSYVELIKELFSKLDVTDDEFITALKSKCEDDEEKEKLLRALDALREWKLECEGFDFNEKVQSIVDICSAEDS